MRSSDRVTLAGVLAIALLAVTGAPAVAQEEPPLVPLSEHFHGQASVNKKGVVTLRYDFEDAAQLADFTRSRPFQARDADVAFKLEGGQVHLEGTGSMRHVAVFADRVEAEANFTPNRNRDFGFAVTEFNGSDVFTLYCVYDRYFSASDGVFKPQNMIIKFLPKAARAEGDGLQDWRYCGSRGQKPEILRRRTYRVSIAREDMESRLDIDDWTSKGREAGRPLVGPMVAVYGHQGDVLFDDLIIRGRLAPDYVEEHRLDLTPTPGAEEDEAEETGPEFTEEQVAAVRSRIGDYPRLTRHLDLAELIRDASIPAELRGEAVERATLVEDRRIVPYLLDGLYAEDEPSRALSWQLFDALVDKRFTFRPDAEEESRSRAIKKIVKYLEEHAADFR